MSDPDTAFHRASAHDLSSSGMTAWAMIETMKRLWNRVVPLIGRKRIGDLRPKDVEQLARDTGGCQKKSAVVAAMHWPESAYGVGSSWALRGSQMARSRLRLAVRALLKTRERTRRRIRRRSAPR